MNRKFLVVRADGIKRGGTAQLDSSCFPIEVEIEAYLGEAITPEDIVRRACDQLSDGYVPKAGVSYVVVPMDTAKRVHFRRPQPQYDVFVENY